jgi:lipopolysaccharide transport system permease protein
MIAMGAGMIITSLTTKYRDFTFLLGFAINLFMYLTPVVYPTSLAIEKATQAGVAPWLVYLNPLTALFDVFKYAFLGEGTINWWSVGWSVVFGVIVYIIGLAIFNRTEKSFMDTI